MKHATPEKQAAHDAYVNRLYQDFMALEKDLRTQFPDYGDVIRHPTWKDAWSSWREAWDTCPECQSRNNSVHNYSMMWGDGDVVCDDCGTYVRGFDAG